MSGWSIALLADGNVLVEGLPGLAKTRAIKSLSAALESDFSRIQFTPDLLPSDVTGGEIYPAGSGGTFEFRLARCSAIWCSADEINRAPAKVQSALLEAMEERQVTVAGKRYKLPDLFMVLATQNPIEQEGTYPLPEAQMDRFLMHVRIDYPNTTEELAALQTYIVALIEATRYPAGAAKSRSWIALGASPRGSLALDGCARAHAWLAGRDYVTPKDVQAIAPECLRHRVTLSYNATADGVHAMR